MFGLRGWSYTWLPGNLVPLPSFWEEVPSAWQGTCPWPWRALLVQSHQLDLSLPGNGWGLGWVGEETSGSHAAPNITLLVPNREFSREPELMPKTPSQKNRQKKKRISYIQDENRDPVRKRLEGLGAATSQGRVS